MPGSRLSRRTFLGGAAAAAVGGAALLAGCGDDDGDEGADTPDPSAAPAGTPKRGGILRLPVEFTSGHFDIHKFQTGYQMGVWRSIANGLFTIDPETGETIGDLAREWSFPDETTLLVSLHENARWQNVAPVDGRPVTAEDVKFSLERLATPSADFPRNSDYALVESIEATGDHDLRITLSQPFVPLLSMLANFQAIVVPPEVIEQYGDLERAEAMVGSGPFILKEADSAIGARVVRNPDYWEDGLPYLDEIEWTIVNDRQTSLAAFRAGDFHMHEIDAIDVPSFDGNDAITVHHYLSPQYFVQGLGGPLDRGPLADPRIREAIDLAVDRHSLGLVAYPGAEFDVSSIFAHPYWSLPAEELAARPGYRASKDEDLAAARALVEEAGGDIELTIMTSPQFASFYLDRAQVFQHQLEAVGFRVNLDPAEYTTFKDRERARDFQLTTGTWAFQNDPDAVLSGAFAGEGGRNYTGFSDPDFEALLAAERAEQDREARRDLISEAQRYLLDVRPLAAFTGWFLFADMGVRNELRGARFGGTQPTGVNAGEEAYQSKHLWLDV